MSFLFHNKAAKKPADLVKAAKDGLVANLPAKGDKTDEAHFTKYMTQIKHIVTTAQENEAQAEAAATLIREACSGEEPCLFRLLCNKLSIMGFEVRKDAVYTFNACLKHKVEGQLAVDYLDRNPNLLDDLILGYDDPTIALNCGAIIRECIHQEKLAKHILQSPTFYRFFDWLELKAFEIASDAYCTFKDLLTYQKSLVSDFMIDNFDKLFAAYDKLLESENYVTKRLSLKLLGEILLDRANTTVMVKYISSPEKLKLMMMLLKDNSKSIQFEAFHVFKVFVANPNKPQSIQLLLHRNKDKLLRYLADFHSDRDDEQFLEERQVLCKVLAQMQAPPES